MHKLLLTLLLLAGCAPKPQTEMQEISYEVIKTGKGVSITFMPIKPDVHDH